MIAMGSKDPRVDAYIAKAPDYAKPILEWMAEGKPRNWKYLR